MPRIWYSNGHLALKRGPDPLPTSCHKTSLRAFISWDAGMARRMPCAYRMVAPLLKPEMGGRYPWKIIIALYPYYIDTHYTLHDRLTVIITTACRKGEYCICPFSVCRSHHCFLTNTCIGFYNQRYFIVMTFWFSLACFAALTFGINFTVNHEDYGK